MYSLLNNSIYQTLNSSNNNKTRDYYDDLKMDINTVVGVYILVLSACLIGNTLVCTTVMKNREMRRKRWYYYVVNLSIADMGFGLITPVHLVQVAGVNVGTIGCKIGIFGIDTFMFASILTLAYISIDRYMCICHPKVGYVGKLRPGWAIGAIWILSILTSLPFSIYCQKNKEAGKNSCDCYSAWPSDDHYTAYKFIIVTVGFYVPFMAMVFSYSKICLFIWGKKGGRSSFAADKSGKIKRSIKMMILATTLFFVSWFPYTVVYLVKHMKAGNPSVIGKLWLFIQVIAFSNSSWNPFTYCVFSTEFRKGFKKIFCWKKESATEENREMKNRKNAADSDNTADCKSNAMTVNTDTSSKNTNGHQTASNSAI